MEHLKLELSATTLQEVVVRYWPHEANVAGRQCVSIICREAASRNDDILSMFQKTEGDHAYGIYEALTIVVAAANLIVAALQLQQTSRASAEEKRILMDKLKEIMREHHAEQLARDLRLIEK